MVSAEYLADFMDGEGYVALGRIPRKVSHEYPVRVVVYNTNPLVLKEIRRDWGGSLCVSSARKPGWKPQIALIWTNAAAAELLTDVAPFLRIKARQATAVLEFYAHLRRCPRARDSRGRLLPLSAEELELRETYYETLKCLNAVGRRALGSDFYGNERAVASPGRRSDPSVEYLAGLMDGEGCFMITKSKGKRSWDPQYRARISLGNTNRFVLEDVQRTFGGILVNGPRADPKWKPSYQLIWTGATVKQLVLSVRPHLRLKRAQASVIIDFIHHQKKTRQGRKDRNGRFFAALPSAVVVHRNGLYRQIRTLNSKGVAP